VSHGVRQRARLAVAVWLLAAASARGQDLVPGAYRPAPVSITIVTIGVTVNDGDISFDPSLPVEDAHASLGWMIAGFNRTLSIAGRYGSVGVGAPIVFGHVEGAVLGQFTEATRTGAGDVAARVAINLYGAPAMTPREFAAFHPATVVGVSATVTLPLGQYDSTRFVNIGTNRWSIKPEVGIARTRGRWTVEGDLGATFFTANPDFRGDTRSQAPIVSTQGHVIYTFRPGMWIAGDGNYWIGGRLTTGGVEASQDQRNSRLGLTVAMPVKTQQVRIAYSVGAYTTIGGDFQSLGVSYSYAWAARR
jgi:hypothetical protein